MLLMSKLFGWVSARLSWVAGSTTCISTLKPRSLLAWSPISLIAAIGAADVNQRDVLDVLRPDRREAGDRPRSDRGPRARPPFQQPGATVALCCHSDCSLSRHSPLFRCTTARRPSNRRRFAADPTDLAISPCGTQSACHHHRQRKVAAVKRCGLARSPPHEGFHRDPAKANAAALGTVCPLHGQRGSLCDAAMRGDAIVN